MITTKKGTNKTRKGARFLNEKDNHNQGRDRSMKFTKAQKKDNQD
jgi:hypothetical protein